MLRPEMNLPERSEFSSQALLLIRFQILYFSQIPERNKDPTSRTYCTDRLVYPIRLSSISFAASRPSRIAHTTRD